MEKCSAGMACQLENKGEGVKRIRDFVSIRQGNRDLYTRCSMRAAAYSCVGIFPTRKNQVKP